MKYSASKLIKCSAAQLVYFQKRKEYFESLSKYEELGTKFQSKIVKDESLANVVADEMRGCYSFNGNEIFFCIDMIKNGEFYEIKSIFDKNGNDTVEYDDWYLENSLIQCAFYKSLLLNMEGDILFTPKFRIKEGYKKVFLKVNKEAPYYLIFGNVGKYNVKVINSLAIIDFYKDKISHLTNYDDAREFDNLWKHKEFGLLSNYFKFEKL